MDEQNIDSIVVTESPNLIITYANAFKVCSSEQDMFIDFQVVNLDASRTTHTRIYLPATTAEDLKRVLLKTLKIPS